MFEEFKKRIEESKDFDDARDNVFYGTQWDGEGNIIKYGIETAFYAGKLRVGEYVRLADMIIKMREGEKVA